VNSQAVLVTGASRGIGRAAAEVFALAGDRVAIHYGRSRQRAEAVRAAVAGRAKRPAYGTGKAVLNAFTRSLAVVLCPTASRCRWWPAPTRTCRLTCTAILSPRIAPRRGGRRVAPHRGDRSEQLVAPGGAEG